MAHAVGSLLIAFTVTLVLLASQRVSNFMAGMAGFVLTALTTILALLACQLVSDFNPGAPESGFTSCFLWSFMLDRKSVISCQV